MYFFEDHNFRSLLILATVIGNTKNNLVILNQLISYNIYRTKDTFSVQYLADISWRHFLSLDFLAFMTSSSPGIRDVTGLPFYYLVSQL